MDKKAKNYWLEKYKEVKAKEMGPEPPKPKEIEDYTLQELLTVDDTRLDEIYWLKTRIKGDEYLVEDIEGPKSAREILLARKTGYPFQLKGRELKRTGIDDWERAYFVRDIIPESECTEEQLIKMRREKRRRELMKEEIKKDDDPRLDEEVETRIHYKYQDKMGETFKLTRRQAIEKGICPDFYLSEFKTLKENETKISVEDIAKADKEFETKESELVPIKKKGFKEWMKGLADKILGKGEK